MPVRITPETMARATEAGEPPKDIRSVPGEPADAHRRRQDDWLAKFMPGEVLPTDPAQRQKQWDQWKAKHKRAMEAAEQRERETVDLGQAKRGRRDEVAPSPQHRP